MADVIVDRGTSTSGGRAKPSEAVPGAGAAEGPVDARAVRVAVAPASRLPDEEAVVVAPLPEPLAPLPVTFAGRGVLGGVGTPALGASPADAGAASGGSPAEYVVDGTRIAVRLERRGSDRAFLHDGATGPGPRRIVFTSSPATGADGLARREVVVDGWRIEVELEPERRAALRERARRGRETTAHGGPTEVHAIIPGRVVSVSVVTGDEITAGQQVLVVEAMKMQNELRAPKDGRVTRIGVAVGQTIEVGDLLLVIE